MTSNIQLHQMIEGIQKPFSVTSVLLTVDGVVCDYPCLLYCRKWLPEEEVEKRALRQRPYPPTRLGPLQSPLPETEREPCVETRPHASNEFLSKITSHSLRVLTKHTHTHTEQLKEACCWVWIDYTEERKYECNEINLQH